MNDFIIEVITPRTRGNEWNVHSHHPTAYEANRVRLKLVYELAEKFGAYECDVRLNQLGAFHLRTHAGEQVPDEWMKPGVFDNLRDAIAEARRQVKLGWRAVIDVIDADGEIAASAHKNVTLCSRWTSKKPVPIQGLAVDVASLEARFDTPAPTQVV